MELVLKFGKGLFRCVELDSDLKGLFNYRNSFYLSSMSHYALIIEVIHGNRISIHSSGVRWIPR